MACDILTAEEFEELYQLTMSLLVEDQDFVLMMSTCNLVSVFLHKDCFDWETFSPILTVLVEWWYRMISERHQLRSTFSIMALLFWEISSKFKIIDKLLEIFPNQSNSQNSEAPQNPEENQNAPESSQFSLFEETFIMQFPPDNLTRLEKMTSLLIQFFNDDDCKNSIMTHNNMPKIVAVAICKLLIRPKIDLATRGVTDEMIDSIKQILSFIRTNKPYVQDVIIDFINDTESRAQILKEFL